MALIVPMNFPAPITAHVRARRGRFSASASLSSLRRFDTAAVDWVKETANFFEPDSRPIMLFDGVCNLCNGGVKFLRNNDRLRLDFISPFGLPHVISEIQKNSVCVRDEFSGFRNLEDIRFEALQSEAGKKLLQRSGRAPDDISSVVLVEKDRSYIKSEAVLKIMEHINLPFPQLAFFLQFVPLFVRDFAYDNIADNRYNFFGRTDSCDI